MVLAAGAFALSPAAKFCFGQHRETGGSALDLAGYGGAMVDAVEKARRLSCMNNLTQIGISLALYRDASDGKWPKNLQVLVEKKYLTQKSLQCPSVNPHRPGVPVEYELVRTEGRNFAETDIIVYDHKDNHKDGRNVLLFNQQTQWLSEDDFKKRMGNELTDN